MIAPIAIHVDAKFDLCEIRYRRLEPGSLIDHDERIAKGATAGIDAHGEVVDIEMIGLDPATVEAARAYASARGLMFPPDPAALTRKAATASRYRARPSRR